MKTSSSSRINILSFSAIALFTLLLLILGFRFFSSPAVTIHSETPGASGNLSTVEITNTPNVSANTDQATQSPEEQIDSPPVSSQHNSHILKLQEIAARLSEGQFNESENELNALAALLDPISDIEKFAFLEFFIDYVSNNAFNPEVITAFERLWSLLTLDADTEIASATLLASHYANSYEFAYALDQFRNLESLGATLNADLYRDWAYAQFEMGEYLDAIPNLIAHIDLQTGEGREVNRREYSMLFESYFRTGNYEEAELIGSLILDYYNDIQDWKDMEQFYRLTGNETGLEALRAGAVGRGLMNTAGEWVN